MADPPPPPHPHPQVAAWLRCAGLSRYLPRFTAAALTPPLFLQLSSTDLDALGVDGPADRKRLTDLIADLRRHAHLPPLPVMHARTDRRPLLESLPDRNMPSPAPALPPPHHPASFHRAHANNALAASAAAARNALRPSSASFALAPPRVTVCVRKRPLSRKERAVHDRDVVTVNVNDGSLCVHELREKVDLTKHVVTHPFSFDCVFNEHISNPVVYENTAKPLVDTLFTGGRGTCFAYGQTGAGKTFTMAGDGAENPGLYTLAVRDVFDRIRAMEAEEWSVASEQGIEDFEPSDPPQVWISFYEIYASKLQDLLNSSSKLECREDGNNQVQIVGLAERLCEVEEDVLACIDEGSAARSTGVTGANDDSSRSHAVFQIELRHPPAVTAPKDASNAMREKLLRGTRPNREHEEKGAEIGRLCFIDLAGSERGSDTANSTKQTRIEGAEINKSLLALKECIRAMDKRKDHTPFRGSKLTQVLKASFVGKNCKTVMIANISPASANVEHTLNTLRYSDRVKEIKKEKVHSPPQTEASRLGGRRATISHGLGLRANIASGSAATPMKPTAQDNEAENKASVREKLLTERKSLPSHSRANDAEILATPARGTKRAPPNRTFSKTRGRASDGAYLRTANMATDDEPAPIKQHRARATRKRTPRAATMIPSRPSTGGTFLPRPPQRRKGTGAEKALLRSNSMRMRSPTKSNVAPDADSDGLESAPDEAPKSKARIDTGRSNVVRTQATSTIVTRRRARELEARIARERKVEDESMVPDSSPDESGPDVARDCVPTRRKPRNRNVAQSAMEFYGHQAGDELSDDELLFVSCDSLVDEATCAVQERLGAVVCDMERAERGSLHKVGARKGHASLTSESKTTVNAGSLSASSSDDTSTPSSSYGQGAKTKAKDNKLTSVIRMHHVQIEELMRLTEADVTLVNAAEKGEIDAQEYAMKLGLNLSQKMDLVRRLRDKLVLLE